MFDVKKIVTERDVYCGPTSLQMLLDYYGIEVPQEQLIEECHPRINGVTALDVKRVGNMHGLDMFVYSMEAQELIVQDRPCICWWRGNHFVVFCGQDDNGKVMIADPSKGKYRMQKDTFGAMYSGVAIFNGEPHELLEPTAEERLEAQIMYTALMTDTLLVEEV